MVKNYSLRVIKRLFIRISNNTLGTITHVHTETPVVAFTFDDGPHPLYTPLLLKVLEKYDVKATFFMVGEAAKKHPQLTRLVAKAGHEIGNHSWDHTSFISISSNQRRFQLRACEKAIAPYRSRLFRPPWGHQSLSSFLDARLLGYQVITWNVVAEDWMNKTSSFISRRLIRSITPGSIVLLHDAIYKSRIAVPQYYRQPMIEALDFVLERLRDRFRFITVSELLRHGRPAKQVWNMVDESIR